MAVVVGKSQKLLDFIQVTWDRLCKHSLNLAIFYMYAISIQHMSKEFYGSHEQVTLAFLYMQIKVLELCKHLA